MDRFSFLNAAHSQLIEDLYQQYLKYPDSLEPSWKAFFQGFDFALENYGDEDFVQYTTTQAPSSPVQQVSQAVAGGEVLEHIKKEFKVVNLIEAYRTRGHLFTKTNPVRERRHHEPTLDLENFGLSNADLDTQFNCAVETGMKGAASLRDIIKHLENIYCDSIGVEYMHINNVAEKNFIKQWIQVNENHPSLSPNEKTEILSKLNQAVALKTIFIQNLLGKKDSLLKEVKL